MTSTIIRNPLFKTGHIYEVRILDTPQGTVSGYFDNEASLNAAVAPWDGKVKAIYVTMNPVNPDLFPRASNRLVKRSAVTTADPDILNREWLLIDLDVTRPKNTSSTEAEHQAALEKAITIQQWLTEQGWPEPIVCDSGNGTHLLYAIDLPNTAASTQTIKAILKGLAERFDDATVKVDTSVHNASRITKLYGTMACKGEHTPDRPHVQRCPRRRLCCGLRLRGLRDQRLQLRGGDDGGGF